MEQECGGARRLGGVFVLRGWGASWFDFEVIVGVGFDV